MRVQKGGKKGEGFTIVELLIVIVVIAILAAITIVAYNGITQRATEATMQSDLRNAANAVENDKTVSGNYPSNASDANGGKGLQASGSNQLTYLNGGSDLYCIKVTNPSTSAVYHVSSSNPTVSGGSCGVWTTTLAGNGTIGHVDGPGVNAEFGYAYGVAVGPDKSIYVADSNANLIRKISPNGDVSTFAGSGAAGFVNGTGTAAQFHYPYRLAVDSSGNVYVSDISNYSVRKITPGGVVTTLAGAGTKGYVDGTGTSAQFYTPSGITVDSSGNVYIVDNFRVRKITPGGTVSTIAGTSSRGYVDGPAASAQFDYLQGITIDKSGSLYVTEGRALLGGCRIRKITSSGTVSTFAGDGTSGFADGTGTAAKFDGPDGIAIDASQTVYVADENNNTIRKITQDGTVTTLAGSSSNWGLANGPSGTEKLNYPVDVAVDGTGTLYVMDNDNYAIRKIDQ